MKINLKISGALLFTAGSLAFMGIITAESFYPVVYTTFKNKVSDLGATQPPNSIVFEPSTTLIISSMFVWVAYPILLCYPDSVALR